MRETTEPDSRPPVASPVDALRSVLTQLRSARTADFLTLIAAALLLSAVVRYAWLSDDAFVSFRYAANLVDGRGLVFNPPERVQGFTNPLWTLLVAIPLATTADIYLVAIAVSIACTLGVVLVIWRHQRGRLEAAWIFLILAMSITFVSYSTSGLENPLAHLLLAAFFVCALQDRRPVPLFLLGALIAFNRMDHVLLVTPVLVAAVARKPYTNLKWAALGMLPLLAWLAFSLVYYGFPFPNTAYAKLNVGMSRADLLAQGFSYLVDSLITDPLVVPLIVLSVIVAVAERRRRPVIALLGAGVAAYVLYVCWIGGDFMSGRFLAAPFLMAVLIGATMLRNQVAGGLAIALLAVLAGNRLLQPMPADLPPGCAVPPAGIVDERSCYVSHTGIAQNLRASKYRTHAYFAAGQRVAAEKKRLHVTSVIGMFGYAAGPDVHVLDAFALTDPLLARIQYLPTENWRPGHLDRKLPVGYVESIEFGRNMLTDGCLRGLLDDLWAITRGPLLSWARWRAIVARNVTSNPCAGRPTVRVEVKPPVNSPSSAPAAR